MNVPLYMVHFGRETCTRVNVVTEPCIPEPFYVECCGSGVRCTVVAGCAKGTEGLSYDFEYAVAQKIDLSKDSMWSEGSSSDEGGHDVENIMLVLLHITLALHSCQGSHTKKNCVR